MLRRLIAYVLGALLALPLPVSAAPRYAVTTIPVGDSPERLLASPVTRQVFAVCVGSRKVVVLDPLRKAVVREIPTAAEPRWLTWDPTRDRLLVVEVNRVEAFSAADGSYTLVGSVETNIANPTSAEYDARNDRLLIVGFDAQQPPMPVPMGVVDTAGFSFESNALPLGTPSYQLLIDAPTNRIFVPEPHPQGSNRLGRVRILDADTFRVQQTIPGNILQTAYSPFRDRLYMLSPSVSVFYTVDVQRLPADDAWTYAAVGVAPLSFALDEDRDLLYVGHGGSTFVSRVDLSQIVVGYFPSTELPVPMKARTVALDAARERLFAVAPQQNAVTVLDTSNGQVLTTLTVGESPRYATVDAFTGNLITTNWGSGSVSFVSLAPDPTQSTVTASPREIAADGASTSRITVTPIDENGPLGPGLSVQIESTAGVLLGSVIDVGDGTYTQDLRSSSVVETAIVTATVEGVVLEQRPHVAFTRDGWPTIIGSQPEWGIVAGGTEVLLTGRGFTTQFRGAGRGDFLGNVQVSFGGVPVPPPDILSVTNNEIRCLTPPHAAAVVDVMVSIDIDGETRSAILRHGYTYVEDAELGDLKMTEDLASPGNVRLIWSDGPTGPVRVIRSSSRDFTADRQETPGLVGPEAIEVAPVFPSVLYYRVER